MTFAVIGYFEVWDGVVVSEKYCRRISVIGDVVISFENTFSYKLMIWLSFIG